MLCRRPYIPPYGSQRAAYPCKQCMPCRLNRRREWTVATHRRKPPREICTFAAFIRPTFRRNLLAERALFTVILRIASSYKHGYTTHVHIARNQEDITMNQNFQAILMLAIETLRKSLQRTRTHAKQQGRDLQRLAAEHELDLLKQAEDYLNDTPQLKETHKN